jgi:MtfA peptidase
MADKILTLIKKLGWKKKKKVIEDPVDDVLPADVVSEYEPLLQSSLPYYNSLTGLEKDKFLKRLYRFYHSKDFHFVGLSESKEPSILISAVAIQITFGLKRFMLPFFRDIYITPDAYQVRGTGELYIGHVSPTGIYISWKHFLEGFRIPDDGLNVAYHEMAHAVHHENFIEHTGIDWDFREDFAKLSHVFGPSMSQLIKYKKSYLRGYAFRDFYEFWAVSVEAFFEDPKGLLENMPQLYDILRETLNQDPLQAPKVLASSN